MLKKIIELPVSAIYLDRDWENKIKINLNKMRAYVTGNPEENITEILRKYEMEINLFP